MDPDAKNASARADNSKIIRNREVDKAAKQLAAEHLLPESPGKKLSWNQMQEYLGLLTPEMWAHFSLYCYRLRPKIRKQLKDPKAPNYIDCFGEPFTTDYFIGRHGGGKYMLQAVDTDKRREDGSELFQCFYEVDDVQYPPVLDLAELELDARENQSYITWLKTQGMLDSKGNVVDRNSTPPAANNGTISAKDILDILRYVSTMNADQQNIIKSKLAPEEDTISKSVGQILLEKMKQDDPAKQVQMWSGLVAGLKDIIGTSKSDTGISQIYDRLITMQGNHNETIMKLLDRLFQHQNQNQNQQPHTALDEFEKLFTLLDRAKQWGGGGGGRRSGWDIGYDIARDIGLPFIQTFGATITNIMALRRGQAPPVSPTGPGAPVVPTSFDPYANPGAAAAYASALNAPRPPAPASSSQPQPPPAGGAQPAAPATPGAAPPATATAGPAFEIFQQYGSLVLNALNNGTPGYAFADYVVGLLGTATHAMIANHTENVLVSTMLAIPEFQIFGEARLRTFVNEFIHYEEFSDEPDEVQPEQIEPARLYQPPRERKAPARP